MIDAGHPVIVPFGGSEQDRAALELGAWIEHAHAKQAPLKLLGASVSGDDGDRDASERLLANASLVAQQLAGIAAEYLLVPPGDDVIAAGRSEGVLVTGLSERWREEGAGRLRSEIARSAPAPILFVKSSERPGALASKDKMTRFRWSAAGGVFGSSLGSVTNKKEAPCTPA